MAGGGGDDLAAVSARSCSHSDLPTFTPLAARKVLAMPPPMTRMSTLAVRLPRIRACSTPWRRRPRPEPAAAEPRGPWRAPPAPSACCGRRRRAACAPAPRWRHGRGGPPRRRRSHRCRQRRELLDEIGGVLLLARVESGCSPAPGRRRGEGGDGGLGIRADAVAGERHGGAEALPDGRPRPGRATGFASRPFGRPKWECRMAFPPFSVMARMVGRMAWMRGVVGDAGLRPWGR